MDVDPPRSSIKRAASPLASSSSAKRPKTQLPDDQLTALVNNMKLLSESRWQGEMASNNDSVQWNLRADVLMHLTSELASTNMKGAVIPSPNFSGALAILKTFTKNELDQWKNGIQNGVENNDWNDLLTHRKYISDHQILHLIIFPAKLQITKVPNVAFERSDSDPQEEGTVISKFLLPTDCAPQPLRLLGDLSTLEKQRKPYGCISKATTIPTANFMPSFAPLFNHRGWGSQKH